MASVFLMRGGEKFAVLQLSLTRPDVLNVSAVRPEGDGGKQVLATVPWKEGPISCKLSLTATGELEFSVAGETVSLSGNDYTPEGLSLSCSSAQFKFTDVIVETDGSA